MADADRDPDRLFLLPSFGKETALVTPIFMATLSRAPSGQNKIVGIPPVTGSRKFPNDGHHTHKPDEVSAMPDNPIHTFFQILGGNLPDQISAGGYRWFEVALYRVLLIGSLAVAFANWRMDATQRTGTHVSI
jgi:hypothetical protein